MPKPKVYYLQRFLRFFFIIKYELKDDNGYHYVSSNRWNPLLIIVALIAGLINFTWFGLVAFYESVIEIYKPD